MSKIALMIALLVAVPKSHGLALSADIPQHRRLRQRRILYSTSSGFPQLLSHSSRVAVLFEQQPTEHLESITRLGLPFWEAVRLRLPTPPVAPSMSPVPVEPINRAFTVFI